MKLTFNQLMDYVRDTLCEADGDFVAEIAEKITGHNVKFLEDEETDAETWFELKTWHGDDEHVL